VLRLQGDYRPQVRVEVVGPKTAQHKVLAVYVNLEVILIRAPEEFKDPAVEARPAGSWRHGRPVSALTARPLGKEGHRVAYRPGYELAKIAHCFCPRPEDRISSLCRAIRRFARGYRSRLESFWVHAAFGFEEVRRLGRSFASVTARRGSDRHIDYSHYRTTVLGARSRDPMVRQVTERIAISGYPHAVVTGAPVINGKTSHRGRRRRRRADDIGA